MKHHCVWQWLQLVAQSKQAPGRKGFPAVGHIKEREHGKSGGLVPTNGSTIFAWPTDASNALPRAKEIAWRSNLSTPCAHPSPRGPCAVCWLNSRSVRFPAYRGQLERFEGLEPEGQGQNLALTSCVCRICSTAAPAQVTRAAAHRGHTQNPEPKHAAWFRGAQGAVREHTPEPDARVNPG